MRQPKSLKDLLLIYELAFIVLILLAVAAGGVGTYLWDRSAHESQRINLLIQEIQQTRGDLYRQMKELFDAYFLADIQARTEYDGYTHSVEKHFLQLEELATGSREKAAINELKASYSTFVQETSGIFNRELSGDSLKKRLNTDLEAGIFHHYELVSTRAEQLLTLKQQELRQRLDETKRVSIVLLSVPIVLAVLLLAFSRWFLKRAMVRPIDAVLQAASEISAGQLEHKVPETGAAELAALSRAINHMADELIRSREALVRTEKQAAQGLLVPMLAHNIRNPLASIRATAQVADTTGLDQDTRASLQDIIDTVDRLERWTGALLAYLHPLKPQPAPAALRRIVDGALAPLQQKLREKTITLMLPVWEAHDDKLVTDEHLLEQALYNVLLNALEASPSHAQLEIQVASSPTSMRLMIADRGPGMPFMPDLHDASPGPSTKRFGTGLGIPFAFKVCEALAGSISFDARPAGGTLVTIVLPRYFASG